MCVRVVRVIIRPRLTLLFVAALEAEVKRRVRSQSQAQNQRQEEELTRRSSADFSSLSSSLQFLPLSLPRPLNPSLLPLSPERSEGINVSIEVIPRRRTKRGQSQAHLVRQSVLDEERRRTSRRYISSGKKRVHTIRTLPVLREGDTENRNTDADMDRSRAERAENEAGANLAVVTTPAREQDAQGNNNITWMPTTTTATATTGTSVNPVFPSPSSNNGEDGPQDQGNSDYVFHHSVAQELETCLEPAMLALHRYDAARERRARRRVAKRGLNGNANGGMNRIGDQGPGVPVDMEVQGHQNGNRNEATLNGHHRDASADADFSGSETETDSQGNPAERVIYVSPSGMPFTRDMLARYRRWILVQAEADAAAEEDEDDNETFDGDWIYDTDEYGARDEDGGNANGNANANGIRNGRVFFHPEFIEDPFAALARARMEGDQ